LKIKNLKMENFAVSLAKELCIVCCKEMDGPILINKRLTKKDAERVKNLNGKVIGWSEKLCDDCNDMKEKGFIFIGYDSSKTDDRNNPWRTGNIWVVKKEAARNMLDEKTYNKGFVFIDIEDAKRIGLTQND